MARSGDRAHLPALLLALLSSPIASLAVRAAVVRVPGDQPAIQAGINAAAGGDTVLVAAGTYSGPGNRDLGFGGKDLVLLADAGPSQTIIGAGGPPNEPARCFELLVVGPAAAIIGFTIQGGDATTRPIRAGGGAFLGVSSATFRKCAFRENRAGPGLDPGGGAIACWGGAPRFENCTSIGNSVTGPIAPCIARTRLTVRAPHIAGKRRSRRFGADPARKGAQRPFGERPADELHPHR